MILKTADHFRLSVDLIWVSTCLKHIRLCLFGTSDCFYFIGTLTVCSYRVGIQTTLKRKLTWLSEMGVILSKECQGSYFWGVGGILSGIGISHDIEEGLRYYIWVFRVVIFRTEMGTLGITGGKKRVCGCVYEWVCWAGGCRWRRCKGVKELIRVLAHHLQFCV